MKTLEEVISYAVKTIPKGYTVTLSMAQGMAWMHFVDKEGEFHFLDGAGKSPEEQVVEAIASATEDAE